LSTSKLYKALHAAANPGDAVRALAMGIQTHEQFSKILAKVEPSLRYVAYETLRPMLNGPSFKVKPLHEYETMSAQRAEREQLPTVNADGSLTPFSPAKDAKTVANEVLALGAAVLTCGKCTVQERFVGATPVDTRIAAKEVGWVYDAPRASWTCPKCPGGGKQKQ